jgi:hypothetical protein
VKISSSAPRRIYAEQDSGAVTIPAAGNTDIVELDTTQVARLALEIKNTGGAAFDAFLVQGKAHPDGDYVTLLSAGADFTSPAGIVVDASGDLTVLASAGTGWLILDCLAFSKIKLVASSAVGGTTAQVLAGGA